MDSLEFTHRAYGELVKQFGPDTTHAFLAWDQLPEAERKKWISAFAVLYTEMFPPRDPQEPFKGAGSLPA